MNNKKHVFSGIQPSGNLHLGNYIGALKQWKDKQDNRENYFCIVDLHSITVFQDPKILKQKIRELATLYIACGIDPEKSIIFIQSHNSDHAQLAWILNCFTGVGQMERMTQYKDKSQKNKFISMGLFGYPVLMAADILLYQTDEVPVGNDQKQHVELTRDIAQRFNGRYKQEIFTLPKPVIGELGARVMSLQNPSAKMSKSDINKNGAINLLDDLDLVVKKIQHAVTDSGSEIRFGDGKSGISNLLQIFSQLSKQTIEELEQTYAGKGYGLFKKDLAEVVINALKPIQEKYYQLVKSGEIDHILISGAQKAHKVSAITLKKTKETIGLG